MGDAERSRLRRTAFGFVFQFGQLVPELAAIENVALPLLLNGASRAQAEEKAADWFPRLGLDGLERRRAGEMSGGQAQRVAVARALVIEPADRLRRRADRLARQPRRANTSWSS